MVDWNVQQCKAYIKILFVWCWPLIHHEKCRPNYFFGQNSLISLFPCPNIKIVTEINVREDKDLQIHNHNYHVFFSKTLWRVIYGSFYRRWQFSFFRFRKIKVIGTSLLNSKHSNNIKESEKKHVLQKIQPIHAHLCHNI